VDFHAVSSHETFIYKSIKLT